MDRRIINHTIIIIQLRHRTVAESLGHNINNIMRMRIIIMQHSNTTVKPLSVKPSANVGAQTTAIARIAHSRSTRHDGSNDFWLGTTGTLFSNMDGHFLQ